MAGLLHDCRLSRARGVADYGKSCPQAVAAQSEVTALNRDATGLRRPVENRLGHNWHRGQSLILTAFCAWEDCE
jgi:hypothetical protein